MDDRPFAFKHRDMFVIFCCIEGTLFHLWDLQCVLYSFLYLQNTWRWCDQSFSWVSYTFFFSSVLLRSKHFLAALSVHMGWIPVSVLCSYTYLYYIYYTLHEMLTSILNLMKCCQIIMCGGRSNGVWDAEKGLPYLMRTNTRKRVSKTFLFFI